MQEKNSRATCSVKLQSTIFLSHCTASEALLSSLNCTCGFLLMQSHSLVNVTKYATGAFTMEVTTKQIVLGPRQGYTKKIKQQKNVQKCPFFQNKRSY